LSPHKTISTASIPATNLVAFKTWPPIFESDVNGLLVSAKQLRKLCLGNGPSCNLSATVGKLPPLGNLSMASAWLHNLLTDDIAKVWDFSQLTTLFISDANLATSMRTLSPDAFPALRYLYIHEPFRHRPEDAMLSFHQLTAFVEKLDFLKELTIPVPDLGAFARVITKHGRTLERLAMRGDHLPPLGLEFTSLSHFQHIQHACVNLRYLYIDICITEDIEKNEARLHPFHFRLGSLVSNSLLPDACLSTDGASSKLQEYANS
jgi:hypothetical protein